MFCPTAVHITYCILYYSADGSRPVVDLFFVDSQEYDPSGGYGCVSREQIEWCAAEMEAVKKANGGAPVPALYFQHIIVPEIYDALTPVEEGTDGALEGKGIGAGTWYAVHTGMDGLLEAPCPPNYSNHQFDFWMKSGSVMAGFFGHDHKNSFTATLNGINLVACPGAIYTSYHDPSAQGVRMIELDENTPGTYTTWVRWFKDMNPSGLASIGRFFGQPHLWEMELPVAGLVLALGAIGLALIRRKRHRTAVRQKK